MKSLSDKTCSTRTNAWGGDSYTCEQAFEIEAQDAGLRPNYLGFGHRREKVSTGDRIVVYTDKSNWTCWTFSDKTGTAKCSPQDDGRTFTECDECAASIPDDEPSEVNKYHQTSCSLHPEAAGTQP